MRTAELFIARPPGDRGSTRDHEPHARRGGLLRNLDVRRRPGARDCVSPHALQRIATFVAASRAGHESSPTRDTKRHEKSSDAASRREADGPCIPGASPCRFAGCRLRPGACPCSSHASLWCASQVRMMCNRYWFAGSFRGRAKRQYYSREKEWKGAGGAARCGRRRGAARFPLLVLQFQISAPLTIIPVR